MHRILLAGTAVGILIMASALQPAPILIRFLHEATETTPEGQGIELLEQLVK